MFCPYCTRDIKDNELICPYCSKVLPDKNASTTVVEPMGTKLKGESETISRQATKKGNTNFRVVKAIITVSAIVVLLIIVFQLYYPSLLPWN
jgi:hypothetical protein